MCLVSFWLLQLPFANIGKGHSTIQSIDVMNLKSQMYFLIWCIYRLTLNMIKKNTYFDCTSRRVFWMCTSPEVNWAGCDKNAMRLSSYVCDQALVRTKLPPYIAILRKLGSFELVNARLIYTDIYVHLGFVCKHVASIPMSITLRQNQITKILFLKWNLSIRMTITINK